MTFVSDEKDVVALFGVVCCLCVNFCDERAGGVDYGAVTLLGELFDVWACAVRAEDECGIFGYEVDIVDESDAARFEVIDDVFVMYDFVVDVERGAERLYCLLDGFDSHDNTSAEASWICQ